ncbi:MAG: DUF2099 family protein [Candidatus Methanoplasma sp.]|jgi:putative methanogenesis marker protein 8|nr:DUF2099 family protein [Candidatus Methanoplasma sp.]
MARHVIEALGKTRVVIEDGKVVEVGEPQIKYCPLFKKYRNIDEITPEIVRENMEFRMRTFGMCCEDRDVKMEDFLSFGVSEILSSALRHKRIDAAVIAADGCGTVVVNDPEIVQGLGGRMSGLCETSPIDKVIEGVGRDNVLDPDTAKIDMMAGAEKAKSMGHNIVAVTITNAEAASALRERFGNDIIVIAVHTSGTCGHDARSLFDACDIITACASECVREESKNRDVLVVGSRIPIFGVSDIGKDLVQMRLTEIGKQPHSPAEREDPPSPLI